MTFSPMQVPTPQNGVTGTQRLYPLVINQDCTTWKIPVPSYASAPMAVTPEQYELAKIAYLKYVGSILRLFDTWSGGTNGNALAELMADLHATVTVAEYKAAWAAMKFGTDNCPAKRFVLGLGIEKYAGLAEGQADTFKSYGPGQVINLMQCNGLASWTGLKQLVPPANWSTRRLEFKKALAAATNTKS